MSRTNDIACRHTNARMSKIVCNGALVYLCGRTAGGSASADGFCRVSTRC
jgi:hypothetical protein